MKKISLAFMCLLACSSVVYTGVSVGAERGVAKAKVTNTATATDKAKAAVNKANTKEAAAKSNLAKAQKTLKKYPKSHKAKKAVQAAQEKVSAAASAKAEAEAALAAIQAAPVAAPAPIAAPVAPAVAPVVVPVAPIVTTPAVPAGQLSDVVGDVQVTMDGEVAQPALKGAQLKSGMRFTTGDKSSATLKFDDGEVVALTQNTSFKIEDYRYNPKQVEKSNIYFSMLKGGLRALTGLIGSTNHDAFKLSGPGTTIGIRGTEFLFSLVDNVSYMTVTQGSIAVTTVTGEVVTLGVGQVVAVTAAGGVTTGAAAATAAANAGAFSGLDTITLGAAGSGAGAAAETGAAGAATGVISGTTLAAGAVGVAVVAAAASGGSSGTGTTGSTPLP